MAEAKVFAFTGDGAQISCSARGPFSDQPGLQPTFTYQDQELNLTFSAGQIRRKRT